MSRNRLRPLVALLLLTGTSSCHRGGSGHGGALADVGSARSVADTAHVLSKPDSDRISEAAAALKQATGRSFAVVTVTSLQGRSAPSVVDSILSDWSMSAPGRRDSAILLLATKEKALVFGVEPGMRPVLTDDRQQAIRRDMIPSLMSGALSSALATGSIETMDAMRATATGRR